MGILVLAAVANGFQFGNKSINIPNADAAFPLDRISTEPGIGYGTYDEKRFDPLFIRNEAGDAFILNPLFEYSEKTFDDSGSFEFVYTYTEYQRIVQRIKELLNNEISLEDLTPEELAEINDFMGNYLGAIPAAAMDEIIYTIEGSSQEKAQLEKLYDASRLQFLFRQLNPRFFEAGGPQSPGYIGWLTGRVGYINEHGIEQFIQDQIEDAENQEQLAEDQRQLLVVLYSFLQDNSEYSPSAQRIQFFPGAENQLRGLTSKLLEQYGVGTVYELPLFAEATFSGLRELQPDPAVWDQIQEWGLNQSLIEELRNRKVIFSLDERSSEVIGGVRTMSHIGLRIEGGKTDAGVVVHEIAHTDHPNDSEMRELIHLSMSFLDDSDNSDRYPRFYNVLREIVYNDNEDTILMPSSYEGVLTLNDEGLKAFRNEEITLDNVVANLTDQITINPVKEFWATLIQSVFLMVPADEIPEEFRLYISKILDLDEYEPFAPNYYKYEYPTMDGLRRLGVLIVLFFLALFRYSPKRDGKDVLGTIDGLVYNSARELAEGMVAELAKLYPDFELGRKTMIEDDMQGLTEEQRSVVSEYSEKIAERVKELGLQFYIEAKYRVFYNGLNIETLSAKDKRELRGIRKLMRWAEIVFKENSLMLEAELRVRGVAMMKEVPVGFNFDNPKRNSILADKFVEYISGDKVQPSTKIELREVDGLPMIYIKEEGGKESFIDLPVEKYPELHVILMMRVYVGDETDIDRLVQDIKDIDQQVKFGVRSLALMYERYALKQREVKKIKLANFLTEYSSTQVVRVEEDLSTERYAAKMVELLLVFKSLEPHILSALEDDEVEGVKSKFIEIIAYLVSEDDSQFKRYLATLISEDESTYYEWVRLFIELPQRILSADSIQQAYTSTRTRVDMGFRIKNVIKSNIEKSIKLLGDYKQEDPAQRHIEEIKAVHKQLTDGLLPNPVGGLLRREVKIWGVSDDSSEYQVKDWNRQLKKLTASVEEKDRGQYIKDVVELMVKFRNMDPFFDGNNNTILLYTEYLCRLHPKVNPIDYEQLTQGDFLTGLTAILRDVDIDLDALQIKQDNQDVIDKTGEVEDLDEYGGSLIKLYRFMHTLTIKSQ